MECFGFSGRRQWLAASEYSLKQRVLPVSIVEADKEAAARFLRGCLSRPLWIDDSKIRVESRFSVINHGQTPPTFLLAGGGMNSRGTM